MLLAVVKVNAESRRLTVKDFNVIGFNNATSDFLGKFEDGIVMYKDKEEPDSYCYYPGSSGSFTRHYKVNRSVYRHDTYSSDEYNITIRSNYTNIPHPLGIKI